MKVLSLFSGVGGFDHPLIHVSASADAVTNNQPKGNH